MQAVDASLERFGLDFLDLIFCHRADPETPIEETVQAMSDIVTSGKALYWGTSEWAAEEIVAAIEIAERHHLHKPVMEQPQYNLLERKRVEQEYARVLERLRDRVDDVEPARLRPLTGKYLDGIPAGIPRSPFPDTNGSARRWRTRATRRRFEPSRRSPTTSVVRSLSWPSPGCAANPHVSTVITGASRVEQVQENLRSLEVLERLDEEVMRRIDEVAR